MAGRNLQVLTAAYGTSRTWPNVRLKYTPLSGEERKLDFGAVRSVDNPSRKSSTPFAVTYEAATLPSGRAKLLSSG